jgi:hypothetical protein
MISKKNRITQKIYYLCVTEKSKVLEIRQKSPKDTGTVIIIAFYAETQ